MLTIHFSLYNNLRVKVDCSDRNLLLDIQEFLTDFKKGYKFMPRYKSGVWDGKISLFERPTRSFPYGLFFDVLKHIKREWNDAIVSVAPELQEMFTHIEQIEFKYDLKFPPYPYQKDVIETMMNKKKGIAVVATAGGKSLIISYLIHNFPINVQKTLIIVPTLQLVDQFKGDMVEYGFNSHDIGSVNSKKKEFNAMIVVSTWQSLKNNMDQLERFDAVIVDEVHTAQATTISNILMGCTNCEYRYGVTGTIPMSRLDAMSVRSYLGPILRTYTGKDLADLGFVSKCVIKQVHLKYNKSYGNDYNTIRDEIFLNSFRLSVIRGLVKKSTNSVLILVEKVEKEGEVLEKYLKDVFPDKTVVFLSGRDKSEVRDEWRKRMDCDNHEQITLEFGDIHIKLLENEMVPLSNGKHKMAKDITMDDDVEEKWVLSK